MQNTDTFSISSMCKVLNVSRASFYYYFFHSKSSSDKVELLTRISKVYYDSKRIYGAPRITAVLRKEGLKISVKTVAKYMRMLGIKSIVSIKFPTKKNKMSDKEKESIRNLIKGLDINHINQVWTTDITYVKTRKDGWVYLSSIIDLYSRRVIAWNVGYNMKKELVIKTLKMAFKARGNPIHVIVHSDKGSQYRSNKFKQLVAKHKCLSSFTSWNHSCDENANQESFHASLKKEWLYQQSFEDLEDAQRAIFEYIEGFYNPSRIHSSLGNVSPMEFEFSFSLA